MEAYLEEYGSSKSGFLRMDSSTKEIPPLDNVRRRGTIVSSLGGLYRKNEEMWHYLLLHCEVASFLWSIFFSLFWIKWVMPSQVLELFTCWNRQFGHHQHVSLWKMVPLHILWCIWSQINQRSIEDLERLVSEFKFYVLNTLYIGKGPIMVFPFLFLIFMILQLFSPFLFSEFMYTSCVKG